MKVRGVSQEEQNKKLQEVAKQLQIENLYLESLVNFLEVKGRELLWEER